MRKEIHFDDAAEECLHEQKHPARDKKKLRIDRVNDYIRNGDIMEVKKELCLGYDPNESFGRTDGTDDNIWYASYFDFFDIFEILVDKTSSDNLNKTISYLTLNRRSRIAYIACILRKLETVERDVLREFNHRGIGDDVGDDVRDEDIRFILDLFHRKGAELSYMFKYFDYFATMNVFRQAILLGADMDTKVFSLYDLPGEDTLSVNTTKFKLVSVNELADSVPRYRTDGMYYPVYNCGLRRNQLKEFKDIVRGVWSVKRMQTHFRRRNAAKEVDILRLNPCNLFHKEYRAKRMEILGAKEYLWE